MITVKNLSKRYGDFQAVDDLSFTIEDGHIYGFLGPNGAGKSTTLNIMTGCLSATSGEVKIDGYDIYEDGKKAKKLIGYLPEIPPLYVDQTPREYLEFVAEAKGIRKSEINKEIDKVIEETHIEAMEDRLIKHLSKGYRQRVGIAQALLGNPRVIILDEPTVGLDPMQIIEIRDLIAELGKTHTVILSSHILSEVQAICEKVLIIYKGKLVAFDAPENLRHTLSNNNLINITVLCQDKKQIYDILGAMEDIEGFEIKEEATDSISGTLKVKSEDIVSVCRSLFFAFADKRLPLIQLNPVKTTLEDIFIELTSGGNTENDNDVTMTEMSEKENNDDSVIMTQESEKEEAVK